MADALAGLWSIASLLFVYVALTGGVTPTTTALTMRPFAANAGMASVLIGTLQFSAAMLVATILGTLPAHSTVPMAAVIAGCGAAALLCRLVLSAPKATIGT